MKNLEHVVVAIEKVFHDSIKLGPHGWGEAGRVVQNTLVEVGAADVGEVDVGVHCKRREHCQHVREQKVERAKELAEEQHEILQRLETRGVEPLGVDAPADGTHVVASHDWSASPLSRTPWL